MDATDIYAVIGLVYMRGLYGLNKHIINLLFSDKKGFPVFGATMVKTSLRVCNETFMF